MSLLGPDDPDPVGEINARSTSPFFLICDHAGNAVPAALNDLGLA
jgi:predicted N-formylglutamate amidohydrolase